MIKIGNSSAEFAFTASVNGEIAATGSYIIVYSPSKEVGSQRWPDEWRSRLFTE